MNRIQINDLVALRLWPYEVYQKLREVEAGLLAETDFAKEYVRREAILVVDTTGLTSTSVKFGAVQSMLRVMRFQETGLPILRHHGAVWVDAHADNLFARFSTVSDALSASFALHEAVAQRRSDGVECPQVCVGIGYGDLLVIGDRTAWGNEMNYASKLGEDTAVAGETLLTDSAYQCVQDMTGARYERVISTQAPFSYWRAIMAGIGANNLG